MNDISTIAYKIVIDHTNDTVSLKEQGRKGWLMKSWSVSPDTVAGTCRNAAYTLLERAFYIEHSQDFVSPDFNLTDQIEKMKHENKPLFT